MVIIIKTRLFVVTLFLLVLISMAGVSAADDANDIVANGENVEVIESDTVFDEDSNTNLASHNEESDNSLNVDLSEANEENLKENDLTEVNDLVGDFSELDEVIQNANGELKLEKDYVFNPLTDSKYLPNGISITKRNLVIDGQNHIINGKGQLGLVSCFEYQANITLKNILFINGVGTSDVDYDFHWGAVNFLGTTSANVINCTFINNTGLQAGALSTFTTLYVENCTFINNSASRMGGAISGIASLSTILINSRFIGNSAIEGGAIYSQINVVAFYCIFENNTAYDGGAIRSGTYGYINTSMFSNNFATYGGAISTTGNLDIQNSYFMFNNAVNNTPNIFINHTLGYGEIVADVNNYPCLLPEDFSKLQQDINNCTGDVLTLTNDYYCTVPDSQAFPNGVKINRPMTIDGQGHVIYAANRTRIFDVLADGVIFKNITFAGGISDEDGGAIHFSNSGSVDNCTFLKNYANNGAAVFFNKEGNITNSIFVNNTANTDGGAVYFNEKGTVMASGFVNNTANTDGGAVYFNMDGKLTGGTFVSNIAGAKGGAIYSNGVCDINLINFTSNQAKDGGALYLVSGGEIIYSQFRYNIAKSFGGAISTEGDLNIKLSQFETNIAPDASYNIKLKNDAQLDAQGTIPETLIPKSFADLKREINANEDVLILADDYFFNSDYDDVSGITITKDNYVIDGQGHILYGFNQTTLFTIEGTNVTLKNLILVNFRANGANGENIVKFLNNGTVENCTFLNNTASGTVLEFMGGEIINSNFINNTAKKGGAIDLHSGTIDSCIFSDNIAENAGAVYMDNYGEIINSTFFNNHATQGGGAIYANVNAFINNCTFLNNYGREGGVIYANKRVSVESSNFITNEAILYGAIAAFEDAYISNSNFLLNYAEFNGALYLVRGTVKNSNFTQNQGRNGGAIQFYWDGLVENSTFNLNDNMDSNGGAVYFFVNGTVMNSTFNLNSGEDGGAVCFGRSGFVYNSIFNMNQAVFGSAIRSLASPVYVFNSTFNNNTAVNGTINFRTPGYISDCTFNINQAENGGGIFANNTPVLGCKFNGNQAVNGSAIYIYNEGQVTGCDFYYNYGDLESGSVLYFNSTASVKYSTFNNDIAGSIILIEGDGNIEDCYFNNTISSFGAVCLESTGLVNNSIFNKNSGIANSSGVCINSGKVENCLFTNNSGNYSSSIYSIGDVTVENCNFTGNLGNHSGAVHINKGLIQNANFFNNTVASNGSAIYMINATVQNCIFDSNIAGEKGGAIFAKDGLVKDCSFTNHFSAGDGGAIYANNVTIEDCYLFNNTAGYDGGAVYIKGYGIINNTYFESNYAAINRNSHGGTLYINKGILDNCIFNNSISVQTGGAIYAIDAIVNNSVFNNNSALHIISGYGGAIYFLTNGKVENSNFTNNHADFSGGAIHFSKSGSIRNCNFENNYMGSEERTLNGTRVGYGGAVSGFSNPLTVEDSFFTNNTGGAGGALFLSGGKVINCYFLSNNASYMGGGGIYSLRETNVDNCTFVNNTAIGKGGALNLDIRSSNVSNSYFINNCATDIGGAISFTNVSEVKNCIFFNNSAHSGGALATVKNLTIKYSIFDSNSADDATVNVIITGDGYVFTNLVTPEDLGPMRVITTDSLSPYILIASDKAYVINYGGTYSLMVKDKHNILATGGTVTFFLDGKNIGSAITDENGIAKFTITAGMLKAAKAGVKDLVIKFTDAANVSASKTVKITINKEKASIAAKAKSYIINYGGKYSITLKDSKGKAIANRKVVFYLKGKKIATGKTNKKGVATIKLTAKQLKAVKAGKRNLMIKFAGDAYYKSVKKTVKITIKKEKAKIVAKNKSFKRLLLNKKFTVTLKNSKGKAIKKANLILKVKGKTYKAKTNAKGRAVFNIKKLYKKGTFKASITYKSTAYYLKAVKKVQIRMK